MKTNLLIIVTILPVFAAAQIQEKIFYQNTRLAPWSKGSAIWTALIFRDYNLENDIKVRSQDDSLMADNIIKVKHTNQDVTFYDVTGMRVIDSFLVTFYGTFYVNNYDLSPSEQTKKVISKKGPDDVIRIARVLTDSSGRAYFKEWTSGWIEIPVSQITAVNVVNSNLWVNSQQEKDQLIRRFYKKVNAVRYASGIVALIGLTILLAAG